MKRTRFPYSNLSSKLKNQIWQCLDIVQTLKFLKINKELRHFVSSNGPFTKVHEIGFIFNDWELRRDSIICNFPVIQLTIISRVSFGAIERIYKTPFTIFDETLWVAEMKPIFTKSPFLLFRNIRYCRNLNLKLVDEVTPEITFWKFEELLKGNTFLTQVKRVENLYLNLGISLEMVKHFMKKYHFKVSNICVLNFCTFIETDPEKETENYMVELFERFGISDCRVISSMNWFGPAACIAMMESNAELILINDHYSPDFDHFLRHYILSEIESGNEKPALVVHSLYQFKDDWDPEEIFRKYHLQIERHFERLTSRKRKSRNFPEYNPKFCDESSLEAGLLQDFFFRKYKDFGCGFIKTHQDLERSCPNGFLSDLNRPYNHRCYFKKEINGGVTCLYMFTVERFDKENCILRLLAKCVSSSFQVLI